MKNLQAFPRPYSTDEHWGESESAQEGMTLRDYFAGQVISSVLLTEIMPHEIAERCYEIADAMLRERDK